MHVRGQRAERKCVTSQFCCEPNTALKKLNLPKKEREREAVTEGLVCSAKEKEPDSADHSSPNWITHSIH